MVDRVGSRVMALSGVLMIGVGFLLFSQITELWQFYAALIVISTGMSVGVGTAFNAALVNWFRRNRSKVLAIVWSGTPAAGALVLGLGLIIDRYGWDTAALLVGVVMLVVGLPLCLLIRHRPEPYGLHPDGDLPAAAGAPAPHSGAIGLSVAEALHSKAFWVLSLGMAVELMAVQAILIHQVEHLEELGWTFKEATFVASSMVFGLVLGRSPYAFIGDRVDKRLQLSVVLIPGGARRRRPRIRHESLDRLPLRRPHRLRPRCARSLAGDIHRGLDGNGSIRFDHGTRRVPRHHGGPSRAAPPGSHLRSDRRLPDRALRLRRPAAPHRPRLRPPSQAPLFGPA